MEQLDYFHLQNFSHIKIQIQNVELFDYLTTSNLNYKSGQESSFFF